MDSLEGGSSSQGDTGQTLQLCSSPSCKNTFQTTSGCGYTSSNTQKSLKWEYKPWKANLFWFKSLLGDTVVSLLCVTFWAALLCFWTFPACKFGRRRHQGSRHGEGLDGNYSLLRFQGMDPSSFWPTGCPRNWHSERHIASDPEDLLCCSCLADTKCFIRLVSSMNLSEPLPQQPYLHSHQLTLWQEL